MLTRMQSWGLRPLSYDKTGLRPASVLVLYLMTFYLLFHCDTDAFCHLYNKDFMYVCNACFGFASNTVMPDKTLCNMLKCNKHIMFFRAISIETVQNVMVITF